MYPKPLSSLGIPANSKINYVFNTYSGQTYIFLYFNDDFYAEIDECSYRAKRYGYINQEFPYLPKGIDSAFRYTNGMIYFFKDDEIYEYNEFISLFERSNKNCRYKL